MNSFISAKGKSLAWAFLVLGMALSLAVSNHFRTLSQDEHSEALNFAADQIQLRIEERLEAYALTLRGAAALFHVSGAVNRDQWQAYTDWLRVSDTLAGIQGIGFSRLLTADELDAHIESMRQNGFPDYAITPEGEREIYSSIIYLEPFDEINQRAFGYDMYSEPVRRQAMEQARDSGEAALSGIVQLVQESDEDIQAGALMYVPVYRQAILPDTVAQRRAGIIGWAYSPYRMTNLMEGILGDWQNEYQAIGLQMFDGAAVQPDMRLFSNHSPEEHALSGELIVQRLLNFNGKDWLLQFAYLDGDAGLDYTSAWLVLAGGSILSVLLFALLANMAATESKALQLADKMTAALRETQNRLKESEYRSRYAIEGSGDGLWDWNLQDNTIYYSPRGKSLLGYTDAEISNSISEWEQRIHPEDKPLVERQLREYFLDRVSSYRCEHRVRCKDGSWMWLLARGEVVKRAADGTPQRMIGTHSDITSRKLMELELRKAHTESERFRAALDRVSNYVYMKDRNSRYTYASKRTLDFFACSEADLLGKSDADFFPADTVRHLREIDERVLNGELTEEEIVIEQDDGAKVVYLEVKAPIYDDIDTKKVIGILGISTDISELKRQQELLQEMAYVDPLTRLPNRRMLSERLAQAMAYADRHETSLAVIYLDLDGFKAVNDRYGHEYGDHFLNELSEGMRQALRREDMLARFGGDEFVALLQEVDKGSGFDAVIKRLMQAAAATVNIGGQEASVTASIGVSFYPQEGVSEAAQLLLQADQAMYKAKTTGKNRFEIFGSELNSAV